MRQDTRSEESEKLPALPLQGETLIAQTVDNILEAEEPLPLIDKKLKELDPGTVGDAFPALQLVLRSLGGFFFGLKLAESVNFSGARDSFQTAAEGFNQIGMSELRDLAVGFTLYSDAVVALRESNVGRALELFTEVQEYLHKAGKFGQRFAWLIDHMQPDNLFVQGLQALMTKDFGTAKSLIEQASQAAEQVAHDYYQEGTREYFTYLGFARCYRAFYTTHRAYNDLTQFKYDSLATEIDLTGEAAQASELLSKGNIHNPIVKTLMYVSNGFMELLGLIGQLAPLMQMILNSTFQLDPQIYESLRQRIRRANDFFAQAGSQAAVYIRFCDELSNQVNNLERLAKPKLIEPPATSVSLQETAAYESFIKFQEAALQSLDTPLQQLSRWSIVTLVLVGLSVALIIAGAASAMFLNTKVGVVTSISSMLSSLISSVLYIQLRQAQREVTESRRDILKQLESAGGRLFTKTSAPAVRKKANARQS